MVEQPFWVWLVSAICAIVMTVVARKLAAKYEIRKEEKERTKRAE